MRLVLFDIDGTLLLSGGAGSRALRRALQDSYGLQNGMDAIRPDGKTDPQIVREALARNGNGASFNSVIESSFFSRYVAFLGEEIGAGTNFVVLPGVTELLQNLEQEKGLLLGLATGNIEEGAQLKLGRAGLSEFFSFGGFASDSEDRTELTQIAIRRGLQKIAPVNPEAIFVVGDTPHDIIHGKGAGARTLAVASGSYSLEELRAYQPEMAVASLSPVEPILSFLLA